MMSLFKWSDDLSVNIKEIDRQHKMLVDSINELWRAMKDGEAREVIGGILEGLVDYTKVHFTYEEDLMKKHNYPGLAHQLNAHKNFVQKVSDFEEKHKQGKFMLSIEVMNYLKEWLQKHILVTDKKYTSYFNEKGVN